VVETRTRTLSEIQGIVQQIVTRFCPRKVILFGSYACGTPTADSDVDLLVVMANPPSWREACQASAELGQRLPVPLEIRFMAEEEFEETKEVVGGLAYPAHHWGKVLYEADP